MPWPRCHTAPLRNTSPPSNQLTNSSSSNVEVLAVHLGVGDLDVAAAAAGDRMAGIDHPDPLTLGRRAPVQAAARAHQAAEDLGEVPGVHHHQPHAGEHPQLHPVHDLVAHLGVGGVPPPHQHVGVGQHLLGQAVVRLVQRGGPHLQSRLAPQIGDLLVNPLRIDATHEVVVPLVDECRSTPLQLLSSSVPCPRRSPDQRQSITAGP